jgi:hypothetical protein
MTAIISYETLLRMWKDRAYKIHPVPEEPHIMLGAAEII